MKKKSVFFTLIILMLSILMVGCGTQKDNSSTPKESTTTESLVELNISAASSLKEAMVDIQAGFKKIKPNVTLTVNFGASGSLQQQIEQGAPCDIKVK